MTLPDGYYAVSDPTAPESTTFWQVESGGRFYPHPRGAWYGPVPGEGADPDEEDEFERRMQLGYSENRRLDWTRAVKDAVKADPIAARRRFAEKSGRCCHCGRPLRGGTSRLLGIGPTCFDRIPHDIRMAYLAEVKRAHALSTRTDTKE